MQGKSLLDRLAHLGELAKATYHRSRQELEQEEVHVELMERVLAALKTQTDVMKGLRRDSLALVCRASGLRGYSPQNEVLPSNSSNVSVGRLSFIERRSAKLKTARDGRNGGSLYGYMWGKHPEAVREDIEYQPELGYTSERRHPSRRLNLSAMREASGDNSTDNILRSRQEPRWTGTFMDKYSNSEVNLKGNFSHRPTHKESHQVLSSPRDYPSSDRVSLKCNLTANLISRFQEMLKHPPNLESPPKKKPLQGLFKLSLKKEDVIPKHLKVASSKQPIK